MKTFFKLSILLLCALTCVSARAGGILVAASQGSPASAALAPLKCLSVKAEAEISDWSAETSLEQVFRNEGTTVMEGWFVFPIPRGVTIRHFSMEVNGQKMVGEMLEAETAKRTYEDIVRRMRDPALLEYYHCRMMRMRIFPIQPNGEVRVSVKYAELLPAENHTVEYAFPLAVGKEKTETKFAFSAHIKSGETVKTVFSPTHNIDLRQPGPHEAVVGYESAERGPEANLRLFYTVDPSPLGISLLTFREANTNGYFQLNLSPELPAEDNRKPRNLTFALDVSGSMKGERMDKAVAALSQALDDLDVRDCFNVVCFSTDAEKLFAQAEPADAEHIAKAKAFIRRAPSGGTNYSRALELALAGSASRAGSVVFITDGEPTLGITQTEPLLKYLRAQAQGRSVFTFGVSGDANSRLLDQMAAATKSISGYALPEDDIAEKLKTFIHKVSSPVMKNVKIFIEGDVRLSEVYPKTLPDLFAGSTATVMGRYSGNGKAKAVISGELNGAPVRFEREVVFSESDESMDFVASLWGARAVAWLLDQMRIHGRSQELQDEIVSLAKEHGVVTPYTSFLILENEQRTNPQTQLLLSRAANDPAFMQMNSRQFSESMSATGWSQAAMAQQNVSLNFTTNANDIRMASNLDTRNGNLAADIRNVNGRAFYFNDGNWQDARMSDASVQTVEFGSAEWLNILQTVPNSHEFLSLGTEIDIVFPTMNLQVRN